MNLSGLKRKLVQSIYNSNTLIPKRKQVLIEGFPDIEGSAIEVANYINRNYDIPVYYVIDHVSEGNPGNLLDREIKLIDRNKFSIYLIKYLTSKWIFITHNTFKNKGSESQVLINIWHGVLYKRVRKYLGQEGIAADITVGTSTMTKKMFAGAFGVPEESICISGYPRNDILVRAKKKKQSLRNNIDTRFKRFKKIVVWLPTYREKAYKTLGIDGIETGNPFYIKNFEVNQFVQLLERHNTLCIVKPHPFAPKYETDNLKNLMFIDDAWLSQKEITLYHLLGCSDMLISDVSSVIIDYLLIDKPIVCISEDFQAYKNSRGFYFENIEDWIPTKILFNQEEFFRYFNDILSSGEDPYEEKRKYLKDQFFIFQDANSTQRLVEYVFSGKE